MEDIEFRFYSATSVPFGLVGTLCVIVGICSPNLSLLLLRRFHVNRLMLLCAETCGLILITVVLWLVPGLGFSGQCIRELFSLFTAGFIGGLLAPKKNVEG